MRLYLDDDSIGKKLIGLLRKAGHDVQVPADVGLRGRSDAVHLRHCVNDSRVCLSANYQHFQELHELVLDAGGHHAGVLVVRYDNDSSRDPKPRDVVRAIGKLTASGAAIADHYHILNHWR